MGCTKKQLNRLLKSACEIITELEHTADNEQQKRIDSMFNEIKYTDELDGELSNDTKEFGTSIDGPGQPINRKNERI